MKKLTRREFTAAGILATLTLTGGGLKSCDFNPFDNEVVCVYGPPPDYDPSNNEVEDVYGPPDVDPEDWGDGTEESATYDPEENVPMEVYGPPDTDAAE